MAKFIPLAESEKRKWFLSLRDNLPQAARQLNLDPTLTQRIDDGLGKAIANIDDVSQKELDLSASKEKRDNHTDVFVPELQNLVKRWKLDPNYDTALGELLGIESGGSTKTRKVLDINNDFKPTITSALQEVHFVFKKPANYQVIIYSRRANESNFTQLKQLSGKTYIDNRPNLNNSDAEKREYCFSLVKNDVESARTLVHTVAVAK